MQDICVDWIKNPGGSEDTLINSVISKAFVRLKHCNFDVQGVNRESRAGQSITSIEFSNAASNVLILAIFVKGSSLNIWTLHLCSLVTLFFFTNK